MAILNSLFGGTAKRGLQNPFASMTSTLPGYAPMPMPTPTGAGTVPSVANPGGVVSSGLTPRPLPAGRTPGATWGGNPPTAPYVPPFTGILGNLMRGNFSQEGWPDWLKQVWNRGGA